MRILVLLTLFLALPVLAQIETSDQNFAESKAILKVKMAFLGLMRTSFCCGIYPLLSRNFVKMAAILR